MPHHTPKDVWLAVIENRYRREFIYDSFWIATELTQILHSHERANINTSEKGKKIATPKSRNLANVHKNFEIAKVMDQWSEKIFTVKEGTTQSSLGWSWSIFGRSIYTRANQCNSQSGMTPQCKAGVRSMHHTDSSQIQRRATKCPVSDSQNTIACGSPTSTANHFLVL